MEMDEDGMFFSGEGGFGEQDVQVDGLGGDGFVGCGCYCEGGEAGVSFGRGGCECCHCGGL